MNDHPKKRHAWRFFHGFVKIALSAGALYWVFQKSDLAKIRMIFSNSDLGGLLLGFLFFNLSRFIGAFRQNLFFQSIGLRLARAFNLKLYYLGMFYNLFLPGGVGGDGYKIYFLQKYYDIRARAVFEAIFSDRLGGLFTLFFWLFLLLIGSGFFPLIDMHFWIYLAAAGMMILAAYLSLWIFGKKYLSIFLNSFLSALLLQAAQILSALFILFSFGEFSEIMTYLSVFLISSVMIILPVSIGGVGARELTFVYFLTILGMDYHAGVALALMFFLFTALSSLFGIFYLNLKPERTLP